MHDSSKDVKSRKDVPLWGYKFNFKPLFIAQNCQIWAQNGTVTFNQKRLTMGMLKSKLPLIIIVAQVAP